jgi:hypothetical protein
MKISHRQLNVHHGFSIRGEALCFLVLFAFPLDLASLHTQIVSLA